MSLTFSDLQAEVKRRATMDQGGTNFDTPVKTVINTALFRLAREARWRVLRRTTTFDTITSYTTGTGAVSVTSGSKSVTVTGATFLTDNVQIDRLVALGGSTRIYTIKTITGETTFTVDINYDGDTSTTQSYEIKPQQIYNVPVQSSQRLFLWHREWGFPQQLEFETDQHFFDVTFDDKTTGIPELYRMWGADMVIDQLLEASIVTVSSSSASDTTQTVTVFGNVSGYPDFETMSLNGTNSVNGSKSFQNIERVVKNASTTGRITVTGNSTNATIAVLPVGDTTGGIMYRKIRLFPLPTTVFPMQAWYYKDPFRLVGDTDIHELGHQFDEAVILLATHKLKMEQNMKKDADRFLATYVDEVRNLRKSNVDKFDFFPTLLKPKHSRRGRRGRGALVHPNLAFRQAGSNFGPRSRF